MSEEEREERERGPRGRQGIQGIQGQEGYGGTTGDAGPAGRQGVQGVQGREGEGEVGPPGPPGPSGPVGSSDPDATHSRWVAMFNKNSVFVFWVLLIVAIVVVGGLSRTIVANKGEIDRLEAIRSARLAQIAQTDLRICTEVEKVKTQLRLNAIKALKLSPKDDVEDIATRNRTLKSFKAVDCEKLPSAGAGTDPKKENSDG